MVTRRNLYVTFIHIALLVHPHQNGLSDTNFVLPVCLTHQQILKKTLKGKFFYVMAIIILIKNILKMLNNIMRLT